MTYVTFYAAFFAFELGICMHEPLKTRILKKFYLIIQIKLTMKR